MYTRRLHGRHAANATLQIQVHAAEDGDPVTEPQPEDNPFLQDRPQIRLALLARPREGHDALADGDPSRVRSVIERDDSDQ